MVSPIWVVQKCGIFIFRNAVFKKKKPSFNESKWSNKKATHWLVHGPIWPTVLLSSKKLCVLSWKYCVPRRNVTFSRTSIALSWELFKCSFAPNFFFISITKALRVTIKVSWVNTEVLKVTIHSVFFYPSPGVFRGSVARP